MNELIALTEKLVAVCVEECGANPEVFKRWEFHRAFMDWHNKVHAFPMEFCFGGELGLGGKLKAGQNRHPFYMTAYYEDLNPARREMLYRANTRLEALYEEYKAITAKLDEIG